jgi:hypothetical protein
MRFGSEIQEMPFGETGMSGKVDKKWEEIATRKIHNERELHQLNDKLLDAVKLAYRKHHLDDDSVGWDELSSILLDALCEALGDDGFIKWSASITDPRGR